MYNTIYIFIITSDDISGADMQLDPEYKGVNGYQLVYNNVIKLFARLF